MEFDENKKNTEYFQAYPLIYCFTALIRRI